MNSNMRWSRRAFLQGVGYTSAFELLNRSIPHKKTEIPSLEFGYVASAGNRVATADGYSDSGIHVFEVRGDDWKWKQSLPSRLPASLALHPNRHVLYVANEIDEYEGLPRGTVEAYKINADEGTLAVMNRQPLSLSGVSPRHIAVSPDGNYLVAAIHGGGAYNVLPIGPDGVVGRVTQILKEVGAGTHPVNHTSAHPHTVVFDAKGQHLLATDEGCDRVSVFAFQDGELTRTALTSCRPASGPGHIAIHPSGRFFYVSNTLDGSIDCYHRDARVAEIKEARRASSSSTDASREGHHLTVSASGNILYATSASQGICVWKIDPVTGKLSLKQQCPVENRSLLSLGLTSDSRRAFAIDGQQEEILSIPVNAESGELGTASAVAKIAVPRCMVMRSGMVSSKLST
jgi:6-phosphogluconolactonase